MRWFEDQRRRRITRAVWHTDAAHREREHRMWQRTALAFLVLALLLAVAGSVGCSDEAEEPVYHHVSPRPDTLVGCHAPEYLFPICTQGECITYEEVQEMCAR